jgi:hypothetical protein
MFGTRNTYCTEHEDKLLLKMYSLVPTLLDFTTF